jgi:hypothetical protein
MVDVNTWMLAGSIALNIIESIFVFIKFCCGTNVRDSDETDDSSITNSRSKSTFRL